MKSYLVSTNLSEPRSEVRYYREIVISVNVDVLSLSLGTKKSEVRVLRYNRDCCNRI